MRAHEGQWPQNETNPHSCISLPLYSTHHNRNMNTYSFVCVCVCVCVRACMHTCVRSCARVCMRCVSGRCLCVCACVSACVRACVCVCVRVRVCTGITITLVLFEIMRCRTHSKHKHQVRVFLCLHCHIKLAFLLTISVFESCLSQRRLHYRGKKTALWHTVCPAYGSNRNEASKCSLEVRFVFKCNYQRGRLITKGCPSCPVLQSFSNLTIDSNG